MLANTSAIFLAAAVTGALTARIPTTHNYETILATEHVQHANNHKFLVTDITKPHIQSNFQANFFSESCNNGFLGQVTGSGGANCVRSISGTKGIALISQPDGCTGKASPGAVLARDTTILGANMAF
jgi:hypothetical protein